MTVYVDDMYKTKMGQYGRMKMSHMIADTRAELLDMASKIGLDEKYLQKKGQPQEHFDISMSYRSRAIENGASEITMRELARITRARSKAGLDGLLAYVGEQS